MSIEFDVARVLVELEAGRPADGELRAARTEAEARGLVHVAWCLTPAGIERLAGFRRLFARIGDEGVSDAEG